MTVQKIQSGRVPGADADSFVGDLGILFYNEGIGDLRLGDGVTAGGIPLASGGGSGYILPTASAVLKGGVKIDSSTIVINDQVISVLNGVYTTGSYNDPSWLTGLAYSKISGAPTIPTNTSELTNGAGFITASALTGLATEAYVTAQGYITTTALTGYATEMFVNNKFGNVTITENTIDSADSSAISFTPSVIFDSNVTVGGDLLPNTDLGGNLGSETQQWKSLYVSGSTIFVGGVPLTVANNVLTVNGEPIAARVTYADVVNAPTDVSQLTDATGLLVGSNGKDAYEIAVEAGFVGNRGEWLASLVGPKGDKGDAAAIATSETAGIVKIGDNINITEAGTISVPVATANTLGVVKPGTYVSVDESGAMNVTKGAGINTISDIPDVNSTAGGAELNDGSLLIYNSSNERWDTIRNLRSNEMDGGFF